MPQNNARQGLDFKIFEALFLFLSEISNLGLGKPDVFKIPVRDLADGGLNLFSRQTKRGWAPGIEFL